MRILSVVTLVSPDGEYGGPVRVAVNQAAALREKGHEVVVAGAFRGWTSPPSSIADVPVRLFPARRLVPRTGFAGLASPGLQRWLRSTLPGIDVLHIHAARDLVTLPAGRLAKRMGVPYVLQTHGMIDPTSRLLARPLDAGLTRSVLQHAHTVFHLTARERADLVRVGGEGLPLRELGNGVPDPRMRRDPEGREVLYLARLASRKRPAAFVAAARILAAEFPDVRFRLVGPDEGEGDAVRAQQDGTQVRWEGPLAPENTIARMARSSIYVLPSIDEPYPMSVLEAMSIGLPVVVTSSNGLASIVAEARAGLVVDEDPGSIVPALRQMLRDPAESDRMGRRGADVIRREHGMDAVATALLAAYRQAAVGRVAP